MRSSSPESVRRFFAGLTEQTFQTRLGVADPPLLDYLAGLLTRFVQTDAIYGVRAPTGRRLDQVVDMLLEAQARRGTARRKLHRHIGDFTLFWTGVFPEAVDRLRKAGHKDGLIDYRTQGKRAYFIASRIPTDRPEAESDVLERLSDLFELCAYGLSEVRREWEGRDGGEGVPPLWIN